MRWTRHLFQPVDIASLAAFRIALGICLVLHIGAHVWERSPYLDAAAPALHFPYPGLAWVRPMSEDAIQVILVTMLLAAVGILLGLAYRLSCLLYALGAAYLHFMDAARYHNHYYLALLLAFLLTFVPAHATCSLDAWMRRGVRRGTTPCWTVWLLRFQIGIPYLYSGLSKLNSEWLGGSPSIHYWASFVGVHAWVPEIDPLVAARLIAWAGALSDTFMLPLLLWRRTRPLGLALGIAFNLGNVLLFSSPRYPVAMFPWFMLAGLTVFPRPDWPRRLPGPWGAMRPAKVGSPPDLRLGVPPTTYSQRVIVFLLGAYVLVQALVPLRYLLYPGFHLWTEFGRTHAWQMMAATKIARTRFIVTDPATGQTWERTPVGAIDDRRLRNVMRKPALIHRYALHIHEEMAARGIAGVEVRAISFAALNGRKTQRFIDPSVDLIRSPGRWGYFPWVLPFQDQPLPPTPAPAHTRPSLAPAGEGD